jgi:hypothetical protein
VRSADRAEQLRSQSANDDSDGATELRAGITERLRLALAALAAGDLDTALAVVDEVRDERRNVDDYQVPDKALLERRRRALAVKNSSIEKFSRKDAA